MIIKCTADLLINYKSDQCLLYGHVVVYNCYVIEFSMGALPP